MATTESQSADQKKDHFPPPKAWDPEAKRTQKCVMFRSCGEKHSPAKCDTFKKLCSERRRETFAGEVRHVQEAIYAAEAQGD
jgi:hypothetical protein